MSLHIAPPAILVKREGALGDVFDTTPICERLNREFPDSVVHIQTAYPQVYERNPHAQPRPPDWPDEAYARIIDLNMAFEKRLRRMSAIDAYMLEAFGDMGGGHSKQLVFEYARIDIPVANKLAVLHPARSWSQRTLPQPFWQALAGEMQRHGFTVATVGTDQDWTLDGVANTRFPLAEQVAFIDRASVYIGSASGPCHYAACTDTPIVSLLTMSPAWAVAHERRGRMGWAFRGLEAPIACQGCSARQPEVCTYHGCERGDNICTTLFDPAAVADAACEMAEEFKR